ncbi:MAG: hypothetical protein DRP83_00180 [Planctomycetota bacterium]|nr:MAG: hypothetical protein DRP83_00180 [Planctomycetota bacterium]
MRDEKGFFDMSFKKDPGVKKPPEAGEEMTDYNMTGFLRYANIQCRCDRHFGWVCPKCKDENLWKYSFPETVKEAVDKGWVAYVVSYDLTPKGKKLLDRLELRTI